MKKVFISHRMSSVPEWYALLVREYAIVHGKQWGFIPDEEIQIVDNYYHKDLPKDAGRLQHLGRSIQQMEEADYILVVEDGTESRGCTIEQDIINKYHLPNAYSIDISHCVEHPDFKEGMTIDQFVKMKMSIERKELIDNADKIKLVPCQYTLNGETITGYVLEVLTETHIRYLQFKFLSFLRSYTPFHIYGLRHADDDMSEPVTIEPNVIVNRFGWYITFNKIEFDENSGDPYYDFTKEYTLYTNEHNRGKSNTFYDGFEIPLSRLLAEFYI